MVGFDAKSLAAATTGNRQQDRGTYPAGFALNGMRRFVRMLSLDLAGDTDDGQRAVGENVFCKLGRNVGAVGEDRGLMGKTDEQQSDGACHAHQPLSYVRFSDFHLFLAVSRFRCLYGGFH